MPNLGDISTCSACQRPIEWRGEYWAHLGEHQPRHIAEPVAFEPSNEPVELSLKRRREDPIYLAIQRERSYQNQKWGYVDDHPHEVGGWIAIMQKELSEALNAWCGSRGDEAALREILQVIAVGVACLEQHGVVERAGVRKATAPPQARRALIQRGQSDEL